MNFFPLEAELILRTDRHDGDNSLFHNVANVPKYKIKE